MADVHTTDSESYTVGAFIYGCCLHFRWPLNPPPLKAREMILKGTRTARANVYETLPTLGINNR